MRYKVVGQNRDTGARMTLEFEADSKAAAERKASQSGMSVHHAADVGGEFDSSAGGATSYRGPVRTARRGILGLVLFLLVAGAVAWFLWPQLHRMIGR
jgi:hypothetical protein